MDVSGAQSGGLVVKFDLKAVEDKEATAEAGHLVCRDTEYISIIVPGDRNSKVHRPVRPEDKQRFRGAYQDWKSGLTTKPAGMPLEDWPGVTRSQVEMLKFQHIFSVEQLAEVADSSLPSLGLGAPELKQRARDYLEAAKGAAPLDKLRKDFAELQAALDTKDRQLAACLEELKELKKPKKKKAAEE